MNDKEHLNFITEILDSWSDTFEHPEDFMTEEENNDGDDEPAKKRLEEFNKHFQDIIDKIKEKKHLTLKEQDFVFFHLHQSLEGKLEELENYQDLEILNRGRG